MYTVAEVNALLQDRDEQWLEIIKQNNAKSLEVVRTEVNALLQDRDEQWLEIIKEKLDEAAHYNKVSSDVITLLLEGIDKALFSIEAEQPYTAYSHLVRMRHEAAGRANQL